jgi:hypothetical protein
LLGIIIPLINLRCGLFYYLIISLLSDDTPRTIGSSTSSHFTSIHSTSLGPTTIATYLIIFIFLASISYFLIKKKKKIKINVIDQLVVALIALYSLAGIIGLPNLLHFPKIYISDASYIINLAFIYFTIRLIINNKKDLKKLITIIILCFAVKTLVGIIYYYLGMGLTAGKNVKTIYDSIRNLLPFTFFLCFLLPLYFWDKIDKKQKIILFIFSFASLFHIITYSSRGNMILTILGILLVFIFLINRPIYIQKRILIKIFITVFLIITATLCLISVLRPGALSYPGWKLKSLFETNTNTEKLSSASVRILEFQNIYHYSLKNNNIIWGQGLGGYFKDDYKPYVHKLIGGSAYPDEQILKRTIFKPHGTQFVILLKMGLMGLLVYYLLLLFIFIQSYKLFKKIEDPYCKAIILSITAFLPLLYYKNFISKIQIFFGIILAIISVIYCLEKNTKTNNYQYDKSIKNMHD